jgi:4-diphosphocytidyl-2-C-methyl-D-erythritol kinase
VNSEGARHVLRSYAKANLTLDVLAKRPDGYHDIESVIQTISLHDIVTVSVGGEPGIRVTCDVPGIPTDERNLAHKAAGLFFEDLGTTPSVDIHIEKHIPVEAGLGGGSSNAAAVLGTLGSGFGVRGPALVEIAARIGSDVPFFLVGGTAVVRGRGEEIEQFADIPTQWLVIVKPPFGISTPWAYKRLDEMGGRAGSGEPMTASERMTKCIRSGDWGSLPKLLSNDLELPAIERHPEIGALKEELLRLGASGSLMCGSGSAVFGVFATEETAREAGETLSRSELRTFVCRTVGRDEASST